MVIWDQNTFLTITVPSNHYKSQAAMKKSQHLTQIFSIQEPCLSRPRAKLVKSDILMHTCKYSSIDHDFLYMPSSPLYLELSIHVNIHILAQHTPAPAYKTPINPHSANTGTISDGASAPMPRVLRALTHSYYILLFVSGSQTTCPVQKTFNRERVHISHTSHMTSVDLSPLNVN